MVIQQFFTVFFFNIAWGVFTNVELCTFQLSNGLNSYSWQQFLL